MAITTDYDAPRRSALDEEAETESLDALATAAKTAAQSRTSTWRRATPPRASTCPARTCPGRY